MFNVNINGLMLGSEWLKLTNHSTGYMTPDQLQVGNEIDIISELMQSVCFDCLKLETKR